MHPGFPTGSQGWVLALIHQGGTEYHQWQIRCHFLAIFHSIRFISELKVLSSPRHAGTGLFQRQDSGVKGRGLFLHTVSSVQSLSKRGKVRSLGTSFIFGQPLSRASGTNLFHMILQPDPPTLDLPFLWNKDVFTPSFWCFIWSLYGSLAYNFFKSRYLYMKRWRQLSSRLPWFITYTGQV